MLACLAALCLVTSDYWVSAVRCFTLTIPLLTLANPHQASSVLRKSWHGVRTNELKTHPGGPVKLRWCCLSKTTVVSILSRQVATFYPPVIKPVVFHLSFIPLFYPVSVIHVVIWLDFFFKLLCMFKIFLKNWFFFFYSNWQSTTFLLELIILKKILTAQCNGCRRMTPCLYRLVPYEPLSFLLISLPPQTHCQRKRKEMETMKVKRVIDWNQGKTRVNAWTFCSSYDNLFCQRLVIKETL